VSGTASVVRVFTWNIHRGVDRSGRYDLRPIVDLVRRHDPDIAALQEIDSRGRAELQAESLAFLTESLGDHVVEARTIVAPDGHYGHALISRWPLAQSILHDLSIRRREPRFAIETTAATAAGPIHLAAVHLGLSIGERRLQAAKLANIAAGCGGTSVMLGDFNDWPWFWPWRDLVRRAVAEVLPARTLHRTYPARCPLLMLDRIYCRPPGALLRSWTDVAARRLSDHLPVVAEISVAYGGSAMMGPGPRAGERGGSVVAALASQTAKRIETLWPEAAQTEGSRS
jgi:endonuclease/exonuclease/phosphatase family metal-dependent hydrolase